MVAKILDKEQTDGKIFLTLNFSEDDFSENYTLFVDIDPEPEIQLEEVTSYITRTEVNENGEEVELTEPQVTTIEHRIEPKGLDERIDERIRQELEIYKVKKASRQTIPEVVTQVKIGDEIEA